jgi:hypothetical protein
MENVLFSVGGFVSEMVRPINMYSSKTNMVYIYSTTMYLIYCMLVYMV